MRLYFNVYKQLIRINFHYLTEYRANLINYALSSTAWTVFSFASVFLLTQQTSELFGMKREEVWLMTTMYSIVVGIFHLFFSKNFERFSELIYSGQLDTLLLKPLDGQFLVSFWRINFATLVRLTMGILASLWVVVTYHLPVTVWSFAATAVIILISVSLLYALWLLVTTCIIWSPRMANLVEIMYTISGMSRYPRRMYENTLGNFVIALVPVVILLITPVHALIGQITVPELALLFVLAVTFNIAARKFFLFALRFYTSVNA